MEEEDILKVENKFNQTPLKELTKIFNKLKEREKEIKGEDVERYILKQGDFLKVCYTALNRKRSDRDKEQFQTSDEDEDEEDEDEEEDEEEED